MPLAITVSPRRVTPLHAYCTALTSSSPKPSPSRVRVCPRRKNSNQNGFYSKITYLTRFSRFLFWGEDGLQHLAPAAPPAYSVLLFHPDRSAPGLGERQCACAGYLSMLRLMQFLTHATLGHVGRLVYMPRGIMGEWLQLLHTCFNGEAPTSKDAGNLTDPTMAQCHRFYCRKTSTVFFGEALVIVTH